MAISKRMNDQIKFSNRKKTNTDFEGKDLRRSNCFNCDFTNSNFNGVSFRGAQFKACNFSESTFNGAEIVAANLRGARFKQVHFENTLFDTANLEGVDFEGATFNNVVFVSTDLTKATNLVLDGQDVKVFDEMPQLEMSKELEKAVAGAMKNEFIKYARVLDTKEGQINPISIMHLLEKFDEKTLIKGLKDIKTSINKDFCTLATIIEAIEASKEK